MPKDNRPTFVQALSVFTTLAGMSVLSGFPALAQTAPDTGQTPAAVTQPNSTDKVPTDTSPMSPMPSPASETAPTAPATTKHLTLAELLQQESQSGSFKTLEKAVEAAGLTETLQAQNGSFTIFAPTDAAFAALPEGTIAKLLKPENKSLLRQLLAYHVVPSTLPSNELKTGTIRTLGGGVNVQVSAGKVQVNDANVVQPDIQASNGVIHAVNRVLIPASLKQRLISLK